MAETRRDVVVVTGDVTIDWNQAPEGQGLGGIINWERRYLNSVVRTEQALTAHG